MTEDAEDREAEKQLEDVDRYIAGRRNKKREQKARELALKHANEVNEIGTFFVDSKQKLGEVSREQWEALPESVDLVKMTKRKRGDFDRITPVPDQLFAQRSLNLDE